LDEDDDADFADFPDEDEELEDLDEDGSRVIRAMVYSIAPGIAAAVRNVPSMLADFAGLEQSHAQA